MELQLRKQRQRGLGREFETLRDYLEGDDLRDVCWKASARRGALITKQYQTERSQAVWLLLDAGRLLQARVGGYTKLDYATATALAMSQLATGLRRPGGIAGLRPRDAAIDRPRARRRASSPDLGMHLPWCTEKRRRPTICGQP